MHLSHERSVTPDCFPCPYKQHGSKLCMAPLCFFPICQPSHLCYCGSKKLNSISESSLCFSRAIYKGAGGPSTACVPWFAAYPLPPSHPNIISTFFLKFLITISLSAFFFPPVFCDLKGGSKWIRMQAKSSLCVLMIFSIKFFFSR